MAKIKYFIRRTAFDSSYNPFDPPNFVAEFEDGKACHALWLEMIKDESITDVLSFEEYDVESEEFLDMMRKRTPPEGWDQEAGRVIR